MIKRRTTSKIELDTKKSYANIEKKIDGCDQGNCRSL